ncbi:MAG: TspO/MBR family protein [Candidatus Coprovivens sp.]
MVILKKLFIGAIPIAIGFISSLLVKFNIYDKIKLPLLAPPRILFPIVWSILYIFMGIVLLRIINKEDKRTNILLFGIQLFINFIWTIVFFKYQLFLKSFILIIILDILIFYLILRYYSYDKVSSYLLIPYLLWICFASYLNWMIYLLN